MAVRMGLREKLALYLVTDDSRGDAHLLHTVRQALIGGVTTVQLRRKHDDGRQLVELGRAVRRMTAEHGSLYIVNDRVDIALLTDADGVHVGQSDLSCQDVRMLLGGHKIVGVSACTVAEAIAAEQDGADYLGIGAVFPTASKLDADMCHLHGLAEVAKRVSIPIVGIGGIQQANAAAVIGAGAAGVAVVSAVMRADDPLRASADLLRLVRD